ncbi:MAG: MoaD/ThiS family protein [Methanomicrobiales archaeon]|jgi:molybdopterin synthase sulfur carrier subunit|nr:MoaD/ThiS family protein [Methanomicrobiales archaeon]
MITIRSFARLKEVFGEEKQCSVSEQSTVADALMTLIHETQVPASTIFNDMGNVHAHLIVMLNKKRLTQAAIMEQVLSDGDEIILYPPVSGG